MRLPSLDSVFDRWISGEPGPRRGSRHFRRHGPPPDEDTARSTAPKSGARLRRWRAERARRLRRR